MSVRGWVVFQICCGRLVQFVTQFRSGWRVFFPRLLGGETQQRSAKQQKSIHTNAHAVVLCMSRVCGSGLCFIPHFVERTHAVWIRTKVGCHHHTEREGTGVVELRLTILGQVLFIESELDRPPALQDQRAASACAVLDKGSLEGSQHFFP